MWPFLIIETSFKNISMTFLSDRDIICNLESILPCILVNNLLFNNNISLEFISWKLDKKHGNVLYLF